MGRWACKVVSFYVHPLSNRGVALNYAHEIQLPIIQNEIYYRLEHCSCVLNYVLYSGSHKANWIEGNALYCMRCIRVTTGRLGYFLLVSFCFPIHYRIKYKMVGQSSILLYAFGLQQYRGAWHKTTIWDYRLLFTRFPPYIAYSALFQLTMSEAAPSALPIPHIPHEPIICWSSNDVKTFLTANKDAYQLLRGK